VLDPRIYRAAFLPILFALVLAAFSLGDQPRPLTTTLAPDAFDGANAFGQLEQLAVAAPRRRPGSAGDRLVADRVAEVLHANGFRVSTRSTTGQTADGERELTTVLGERVGFSSRRIVVLAHRDALGDGARAELSGTAALLELARVLGGRTLRRTLVLASTSGGSAGAAAADALAADLGGPVDAVIVLGDLAGAGTNRPLVVPWSQSMTIAPLELRRTVEAAVATETGLHAGGDRPAVQFARLAFPLTPGEQGPFDADGIPAVLLSASGELPPPAAEPVSTERLTAFGRAALRSIGALDRGADISSPSPYVVLERKVMPAWPARLLAAALLLPVLLAGIDALARVRRRRERVGAWLGWVAAGCVPFLLAALFAIALFRTGLLDAAPGALSPAGAVAVNGTAAAAVLVVLMFGWFALRPLVVRLCGLRGAAPASGAATAAVLLLCAVAFAIWLVNPFACLLLVPALHLWLLAVAPEVELRRPVALLLFALGLLPPLLVAYATARQFGLGPVELAWTTLLLVAGGEIGLVTVLLWSVALGCSVAVLMIILRAAHSANGAGAAPITVRGPASYAGPGSLGGTESALRR
jgi:spore maturation protein SpmB